LACSTFEYANSLSITGGGTWSKFILGSFGDSCLIRYATLLQIQKEKSPFSKEIFDNSCCKLCDLQFKLIYASGVFI